MANFVHIYVVPKPGIASEKVTEQMNLAIDWYRYAPGTYVVYTSSNLLKWRERLLPLVEPDGDLLVVPMGDMSDSQGWMTTDFWEWLKKERGKKNA